MNILLLNQNWLESELRELGHCVISAGWLPDQFDFRLTNPGNHFSSFLAELSSQFVPDRIVYYDDSGPLGFCGFEDVGFPMLFYSVDAHHHWRWHRHFSSLFDATLVAQRQYLEPFASCVGNVKWFPLWSTCPLYENSDRPVDVCFRGTLDPRLHPQREAFFARLNSFVSVDAKSGPYQEAYPFAKIVINQAVKNDLNFRVFEAMSCGAMLLTPNNDSGIEELFQPDVDIIYYENDNAEDAAAKIRFYLQHDDLRLRIAASGQRKVAECHSNQARAKELARILDALQVTARTGKHLGAALSYLTTAQTCGERLRPIACRMSQAASASLLKTAEVENTRDDAFGAAVVLCNYLLDTFDSPGAGLFFLKQVRRLVSNDPVVVLAEVEALLREGRREQALETAALVSAAPEELVDSASALLAPVRAKLSL